MKFETAGEKRKFYRNMRENVSARCIGFASMRLVMMLAPFALCFVAVIALVMIARGADPIQALFGSHAGNGVSMAMAIPLVAIRGWRESRSILADKMSKLAESPEFRTAEGKAKFNRMDDEQKELASQINAAERSNSLGDDLGGVRSRMANDAPGGRADGGSAARGDEEYRLAYQEYLKFGMVRTERSPGVSDQYRQLLEKRATHVEYRDMTAGGGPGLTFSGAAPLVPVGFVSKIEEALKWFGGMFEASTIFPTDSGQPLPYPTDNDVNVTGEQVGEGQQVSMADVNVGYMTLGAFKYSTKLIRISMELIQDSAFDIESYLAGKFATRLGRILNLKFTTGVGTTEPMGIVVASSLGVSAGTTPALIGDDNATTPDPTAQVGYLDLVNLEHSVDKAYRQGAKFMANDTTVRYWKTLKDKYGRPLWVPGMAVGAPDTVLSYPIVVNNDIDALATGKKPVLFGALDKYLIRRVKDMAVLRLSERFADYGQVAFLGFSRYDGNLLDAGTHPVRHILLS